MKLDFITVEIRYTDGSIQSWDYECVQYNSMEGLFNNMADDFVKMPASADGTMLHFVAGKDYHSGDLGQTSSSGAEFATMVSGITEEVLKNGN